MPLPHNLTSSGSSGGGSSAHEPSPTSPISLTPHHLHHHSGGDHLSGGRVSPVPGGGSSGGGGNCPRRKQARPRRRSGDSVNSSLDLSKAGSPPLSYTTTVATTKRDSPPSSLADGEDHPENLSLRRSHSPPPSHHQQQHHHSQALHLHQQQQQQYAPPAINLVKMEQLVDNDRRMDQDNIREATLKMLYFVFSPFSLKSAVVSDLIEFNSCMLCYLVASAATAVSIGIAIRSQRCQTAGWIGLYSATASTTFRNRYCNYINTTPKKTTSIVFQ
jgi:hypothetical protein